MPRTPNTDTKERILEAAKGLFIRYGFKKSTVDEIALQARVGKPTIYSFFPSKDALFLAIVAREAEGIRSIASEAATGRGEAIQKLEQMLSATLKAIRENPFVRGVMEKDTELIATHLQFVVKQIEEAALDMIEAVVIQGIEEGTVRETDSRLAAYTLYKVYQSFSYAWTLTDEEPDLEHLEKFVSDFVKYGLRKGDDHGR